MCCFAAKGCVGRVLVGRDGETCVYAEGGRYKG